MKIVFPYIAQIHHIPHSFPLAAELSRKPGCEVHIAYVSDEQEQLLLGLAALYPECPLHFERLKITALARFAHRFIQQNLPPKWFVLLGNRRYFSQFAAAVVPERTSLLLKYLGLPGLKLVYSQHGPPGRAITYAKNIRRFDFVLVPGVTQEKRMLAEGLMRPGAYHCGSYPKFDLLERLSGRPQPLFAEARPTVLYNPHFSTALSSWPKMGLQVLDFFAASRDYNLIFAPHIRLFDHHQHQLHAALDHYRALPHVHIDVGSRRSIDMSYTQAADIYLGDVSSQVAEFLVLPRPCVFLNAHAVDWQHSPDYLFWQTGPVLDALEQLPDALATATLTHERWRAAQQRYFCDCFSTHFDSKGKAALLGGSTQAANAIADFLQHAA